MDITTGLCVILLIALIWALFLIRKLMRRVGYLESKVLNPYREDSLAKRIYNLERGFEDHGFQINHHEWKLNKLIDGMKDIKSQFTVHLYILWMLSTRLNRHIGNQKASGGFTGQDSHWETSPGFFLTKEHKL